MSTMPATHGHSVACCNVAPVVSSGYEKKGTYEELAGRNTYVTGSDGAEKGVLVIFDIFGYFDQTLQGADIIASGDHENKYKVFIPDWFDGKPVPIADYPPDTKEKQERVGAFFAKYSPPSVAGKVPDYLKSLQAKNPGIKSWSIIGYCWGGKVVSLALSADPSLFKAGAELHPAMIDPSDAEGIKNPLILLASGDESVEDVKKFEKALSVPHQVETFPDQIHGWMAARGDLSKPDVKEAYARGYKLVLDFFHKNW